MAPLSKVLYSRKSDEYETPKFLYDFLNSVFNFYLDPCAKPNIESQKRISTKVRFTKEDNGLYKTWINYSTFVNPPYSKISDWIEKVIQEYDYRITNYKETGIPEHKPSPIVLLVPARVDTRWFHKITAYPYSKLIFIKGRLQFDTKKKTKAPFPSCIIVLSATSFFDKLWDNAQDTYKLNLVPCWTMKLSRGLDQSK